MHVLRIMTGAALSDAQARPPGREAGRPPLEGRNVASALGGSSPALSIEPPFFSCPQLALLLDQAGVGLGAPALDFRAFSKVFDGAELSSPMVAHVAVVD